MAVFHTPLPNGGSQPRVCDFDDMVLRLVKWHPSTHGLTSTYSELVASRVGLLIGAPVVRGTVVYVEPGLLPTDLASRLTQPFHVGFTYSPGHNFTAVDYPAIQNVASLPAAAVHLAWLQIGDQEGHNQYLYQLDQVLPDNTTRKMNHFIIVDQAAICGMHDWSSAALDTPSVPYNLPSHLKNQLELSRVEPLVNVVQALPEDAIRACFEDYPSTWGIGHGLVDKLLDFVLNRRTVLRNVLAANF